MDPPPVGPWRHPDKNPGDEGAHARFQQILRAYEILNDEERCWPPPSPTGGQQEPLPSPPLAHQRAIGMRRGLGPGPPGSFKGTPNLCVPPPTSIGSCS